MSSLLRLLQLSSPALPVGAFSYSEGLETLVQQQRLTTSTALRHWLQQELHRGAIRQEAAVMLRAHIAASAQNWTALLTWNSWLSASRETEELRLQSQQMGRSLLRLVQKMAPPLPIPSDLLQLLQQEKCHFAIAFGLTAAHWKIESAAALQGYLQSWSNNLIAAAVKLIPLGQTEGQQLLFDLQSSLEKAAASILTLSDEALETCGWGLAIASMTHETQYSRLFRS